MRKSSLPAYFTGAGLLCLSLGGCAPADQGSEAGPGEAAGPRLSPSQRPDGTVSAGFAAVDITWRAGAKPGQVGTESDIVEVVRLWRDIVDLATDAVRLQTRDEAERLSRVATDWTLDYLNERIEAVDYDKYTAIYEPGRGVHTHSHAKAVVVERSGQKVALVRVDLYLMQRSIQRRVAELVAEQTGLAPENILIAATHNHSAADAAHTAAGISTLSEAFDPRHYVWLTHKIAEAIIEADANRQPATMGATRTKLRAVQRNVIGPATAMVSAPDGGEPVEVQAGYPRDYFDDDLFVLDFAADPTGERLGSLIVFAMHPESLYDGHGMLSSDFVGLTESGLEGRWGAPVMWMPGGLGDVEQDSGSNFGTDFWREDFARLDEQAQVLVDNIAPVLEDGPLPTDDVVLPSGDFTVASRARFFPGPANTASPTDTKWQWPVTTYLAEVLPLACTRVMAETANLWLQAIQLGDVVFLGAPSEITTDLARHIRSRTNAVEGDTWDGYLYSENPEWVAQYVEDNFTPGEMTEGTGFVMPVLISQANDYTGYVVTRWEFNNRYHYRMSMTLFGPDTADYIATRLESLAGELRGLQPLKESWDAVSAMDADGEQRIFDVVSSLDPYVAELSANIPFQDPIDVGVLLRDPTYLEADEMGAPSWSISWLGNTSDTGNPTVALERRDGAGSWQPVLDDTSPHLWLMYERGGRWDAIWHLRDAVAEGTYRFRVRGQYRSLTPGTSTPDPLWDPAGANAPYEVISRSFSVP